MELVVVRINCTHEGQVKHDILTAKVSKETEKLIKLEKHLNYKIQYYKTEMGSMGVERYATSFRFWCVDINHDEEYVSLMLDKVMALVKAEILSRKNLCNQWEEGVASDIEMLQG
jgi:hypothetical protein